MFRFQYWSRFSTGIYTWGVLFQCFCDVKFTIYWYDMIYLLSAIGLPPGGSSTVHIYTQTVHRTTQKLDCAPLIEYCLLLLKQPLSMYLVNQTTAAAGREPVTSLIQSTTNCTIRSQFHPSPILTRHVPMRAVALTKRNPDTRSQRHQDSEKHWRICVYTRVGTLIVATIYLQLIQNRYKFRSFTVLHCSHQHCVQPVASDVEVVGYL